MKLDLVSIILLLSIGQGLFLLLILLKKNAFRRYSGRFFSLLLILFLWFQFEFLMIRTNSKLPIDALYITRFGGWLMVGPLLWFYTQSYLNQGKFKWRKTFLWHFIPFFLFAILIPLLSNYLVISGRVRGYGMLTVFDTYNTDLSFSQIFYGLIFVLQFVHAFIYTLVSYHHIDRHERQLKNLVSNLKKSEWGWIRSFHMLILVILMTIGILIFYLFVLEIYRRQMDYFFVIPTSILVYFFSLRAMRNIDLIPLQVPEMKNGKYIKSTLSPSSAKEIQDHLLAFFSEERPYLNPDLRLAQLASKMNISSHHISQVMNENLSTNFYDFVNRYRIESAKDLIRSKPNRTLLQIALEVGFNNKNSFNNAFKKHAGETPSIYRKSLQ